MAREFIGRQRELEFLDARLSEVERQGQGQYLAVRGRRRVGKSRLLAEFTTRSGLPVVDFVAEIGREGTQLATFAQAVRTSTLPDATAYPQAPDSWSQALRSLALVLPNQGLSIVVIDEVPYLTRHDLAFESALQAAWDRFLSPLPVLLILVGSDQSEMERIGGYGRPMYGRGTEMVVQPLSVADTAQLTGLEPDQAIDAHLVTGGMPMLLAEWRRGEPVDAYLSRAVNDPLSALIVSGERVLSSEFPTQANARSVLGVIGSGERTFTAISHKSGMAGTSLERALSLLVDRQAVAVDAPLSTRAHPKGNRYRVADPYLRFWFRFLAGRITDIEAGRADTVLAAIRSGWSPWRGKAVEPIIRDLLWRSRGLVPDSGAVGGWWTRNNAVEVGLVGADRGPVADEITFLGLIKWRDRAPIDTDDLLALVKARDLVPGAQGAPLVAVSRSGLTVSEGLTTITPEDLVRR